MSQRKSERAARQRAVVEPAVILQPHGSVLIEVAARTGAVLLTTRGAMLTIRAQASLYGSRLRSQARGFPE